MKTLTDHSRQASPVEIARPLRRDLPNLNASLEDWGQKKHQLPLKKTVQKKWQITRNGAMKTLTGLSRQANTVETARPLRRYLLNFHATLEDWGQKKHQLLLKKTVQKKWQITRNGAMKMLTVHSRQAKTVEIARTLSRYLLNLIA